jgi:hypothetical protein
MSYQLTKGDWPMRLSDGAFVNPETNQEYLDWLADGNEPDPADTPPITLADYQDAVQDMLDAKAKERNYDDILSLCTYVASGNPLFAAEGQAGVSWRDAAWAKCYEVLAEVRAATRPQPTVEELIAELPAMVWPT